jgi:hypothetical protein
MKTPETREEVSSHPGETRLAGQKNIETPPVPKKNRGRTGKTTCNPMEQEENHEKGLPWSWARDQMGNPEPHTYSHVATTNS